jgi:hypothetical protein
VSFTLRPLYTRGSNLGNPLQRKLGRLQSQPKRCSKSKNFISLQGIEDRPLDRPSHSLLTIPSEFEKLLLATNLPSPIRKRWCLAQVVAGIRPRRPRFDPRLGMWDLWCASSIGARFLSAPGFPLSILTPLTVSYSIIIIPSTS